jgi:hypothetical protein
LYRKNDIFKKKKNFVGVKFYTHSGKKILTEQIFEDVEQNLRVGLQVSPGKNVGGNHYDDLVNRK